MSDCCERSLSFLRQVLSQKNYWFIKGGMREGLVRRLKKISGKRVIYLCYLFVKIIRPFGIIEWFRFCFYPTSCTNLMSIPYRTFLAIQSRSPVYAILSKKTLSFPNIFPGFYFTVESNKIPCRFWLIPLAGKTLEKYSINIFIFHFLFHRIK